MELTTLFVMFGLGLVHGLIPDEHTWPITIPYALGQENLKKAILSTIIFTSALTVIWSILTLIISYVGNIFLSEEYNPYVFIFAGFTMILVAFLLFIFKLRTIICSRVNENYYSKNIIHRFVNFIGCHHVHGDLGFSELKMAPPYKMIWIHGIIAAFGTDSLFIAVYSTALTVPIYIGFLPGFLFGIGTMISLTIIGYIVRRGANLGIKDERQLKNRAKLLGYIGIYLLLSLGIFMVILGILSLYGIEINLDIL